MENVVNSDLRLLEKNGHRKDKNLSSYVTELALATKFTDVWVKHNIFGEKYVNS